MRYPIFLTTIVLLFLSSQVIALAASVPEEQMLSAPEQSKVLNEFSARLKMIKSFQAEFVFKFQRIALIVNHFFLSL